jgi:hypothetical protein
VGLLRQQNIAAVLGRKQCRHGARCTSADHQDIALELAPPGLWWDLHASTFQSGVTVSDHSWSVVLVMSGRAARNS